MRSDSTLGIQIAGIAATVDNNRITRNKIINSQKTIQNKKKIMFSTKIIGVQKNYVSSKKTTTVDLCLDASKRLLKKLKWENKDLDLLVFVTQTPDYLMPSCSNIVHEKLNLDKKCICFDINLGCSGYVYGLWNILKIMESGNFRKGLLLVGDTISKTVNKKDYVNKLLFGDAGSATAITNKDKKKSYFVLGSDGKGNKDLIIDKSGFRSSQFKPEFKMEGKNVFHFAINNVPKLVKKILKNSNNKISDISYFVYHQANKYMIDSISNELKIKNNQLIFSINDYGNTSSASIPVTLCNNYLKIKKNKKFCLLGFGAGFSYAAAILDLNNAIITKVQKKNFRNA